MKNIVGAVPRGANFFPRHDIINLIYKKLETNRHINIEAPRRVGKSAIMYYLSDNPRDGYDFKYTITQSIDDSEMFFKELLEQLKEFKSATEKTKSLIKAAIGNIQGFTVMGQGVTIKNIEKSTYLNECKLIVKNYTTSNNQKIILMIDEFPQTVENINKAKGELEAKKFLWSNRELQQSSGENIHFIYTGSIGLKPLCNRLGASDAINTLGTLKIPPLRVEEANQLCKLILETENIQYADDAISYLLKQIHWLIPFHIQLVLQELIDGYYMGEEKSVVCDSIDRVIDKLTKKNSQCFDQYHEHIIKVYPKVTIEYIFIKALLNKLSQIDTLTKDEVHQLAIANEVLEGIDRIINHLEYDGYIHQEGSDEKPKYRFTSLIIRLWWRKNMI
jgi:uncharacterized protein